MKRSSLSCSSSPDDVVIVAALRTPLTRSVKGGLSKIPAHKLLSTVVKGVLEYCEIPGSAVEDICVGNVLLPAAGFATLRMAMMAEAGIPYCSSSDLSCDGEGGGCGFQMVNRQCASSLQAISIIANAIAVGEISIGIGAGVESMSQNPMSGMQLPNCLDWDSLRQSVDAMNCLLPMGVTSDTVVARYGLQRHDLDAFAVESHRRAHCAQIQHKFDGEIVPCAGIQQDDGIRPHCSFADVARLKPVFTPTGATTAGNSSQTTDGAAAVLLMRRAEAARRRLPVLAVWRGYATASVPPEIMGIGPAYAIPKLLRHTGITLDDVHVVELNEAFASQALWCMRHLHLDPDKVNPNGGAIALGHPLGATGARLVTTLLSELHRRRRDSLTPHNSHFGIVSMCVGTGMGAAALLEVESYSHCPL